MSFSSTTARVQYNGDGSTLDFSVPFPFQADADIGVIATTLGVDVTKALSTDYTVSGEGTTGGGNVRFVVAPASGTTITIFRDLDLNQTRSFSYNREFPTATVTAAADKAMQATQQLYEQIKRVRRISVANAEIPELTVADRAGTVDGYDANGAPTQYSASVQVLPYAVPFAVSTITAAKAVSYALFPTGTQIKVSGRSSANDGGQGDFYIDKSDTTTAEDGGIVFVATDGTRLKRIYSGPVSVLWFGAPNDGSTDARAALILAVAGTPAGGSLEIPLGTSYYRVTDSVTINKAMTVIVRGQVRSTDNTKVLFLVTASNVTFDFRGGSLRGPGTFLQTGIGGSNYGCVLEFRGTSVGAPLKNCQVLNPSIIDPPHAGIYFRYVDGWKVIGGTNLGGPATETGTNHFAILALDSLNWLIQGFENRPDPATGGAPVQVFCNTHSSLTSSPGVMNGCINLGSWDKLIYQYIDGAVVTSCYSLNKSVGGSRQSVRTGGRSRVANNILQGGVAVVGPDGSDVSHNYIYDYDHVGISLSYVDGIGTTVLRRSMVSDNTIIATTPGTANVTEIYEGIRVESTASTNVADLEIGPNTIIAADMCSSGTAGASANLGAISILASGSFTGEIRIGPQNIIGCGSHGIVAYNARDLTIDGGEFRNVGSDSSSNTAYAVRLVTSANRVRIRGVKAYDTRGGSSRLAGTVLYSGAGNFDNNVVQNCKAIGVKSGQPGINLGNPFATPTLTEIGGNGASEAPLTGQFTMTATTFLDVANTAVIGTTPAYYSMIRLTPLNTSANTLMNGSSHLIIGSTTARTGFRVQTYDGGSAAGTEVFFYEIVQ